MIRRGVRVRGKPLTLVEREEIFRGLAEDLSARTIAARLGRDPSVISREIARNGGRDRYRAHEAAERTEAAALRPKPRKLESNRRLRDAVAAGLEHDWSPAQIAGRLRREHPDDEGMWVSHETIYQALYLQSRGELATQLKLALRTGRATRIPRDSTPTKQTRINGMVAISERPQEATDRTVPGRWEGDLITGQRGKSQIATRAERVSRFTKLVRVPYDRTAGPGRRPPVDRGRAPARGSTPLTDLGPGHRDGHADYLPGRQESQESQENCRTGSVEGSEHPKPQRFRHWRLQAVPTLVNTARCQARSAASNTMPLAARVDPTATLPPPVRQYFARTHRVYARPIPGSRYYAPGPRTPRYCDRTWR